MGPRTILDSLNNVSAEIHDLYEEKDGKFVLILDDVVKSIQVLRGCRTPISSKRSASRGILLCVANCVVRLAFLNENNELDKDSISAVRTRIKQQNLLSRIKLAIAELTALTTRS